MVQVELLPSHFLSLVRSLTLGTPENTTMGVDAWELQKGLCPEASCVPHLCLALSAGCSLFPGLPLWSSPALHHSRSPLGVP